VAGTVEAVGKNVTQFQAGDDVFGTCDGSFAEHASTPQETLAPKPANLTFEQAAVVPTSGFAALQALRDAGGIRSGQHVLIVGASGGVGQFAVQIAKSFGAEVTGVCSTAKVDIVRSLGADHVIDYSQEDLTQTERRYDLILEMGGNHSLAELRRLLRPGGTLVPVGSEGGSRWVGGRSWIQAMLLSRFVHSLRPLSTKPNHADLQFLNKLVKAGKIIPIIDKTYPLSEVPKAMTYLKQGRARGKITITILRTSNAPRAAVSASGEAPSASNPRSAAPTTGGSSTISRLARGACASKRRNISSISSGCRAASTPPPSTTSVD
jgi:NADPH:quinone reductase-like Zn-dependent oxidoreductase